MSLLRLSMVQTALTWEQPAANLAHFSAILDGIHDTDLVVLPEMFSTGFSMASSQLAEKMDGAAVTWMLAQAERLGAVVCGSLIISDGDRFYNRLVWAEPGGNLNFYDKRHLFRMSTENDHYSAGHQRIVPAINGFRICPLVCYDLRFPAWSRNRGDYDLLLYVANWPAARRHHWNKLLPARAIENLSYVAGLNRIGTDGNNVSYAGDSVILDYEGQALMEGNADDTVLTVQLDQGALETYRNGFPAHLDADRFDLA